MKENKRVILLVSIAIFALLVIVVGATFAYFRSSTNLINGDFNLGVGTAQTSSFSAYTEGNIVFNISASQMTEAGASNEYIATDNATGTAIIGAGNNKYTTTCTYDLVWVWDSTDRYMMSDVTLPHTHTDGTVYPYEFSVKVDDEPEQDLSSLDWTEEGKAVISHKTITSENGTEVENNFNIEVRMYNIPVNQNKLFNKKFNAHITVENNKCTVTKAGVKLNYYVKNLSATEYTGTENVPKGNYKLVTDKTSCQNGGTINNYDRLTGTIDTTIGDIDKCDIYFQELEEVVASGSNTSYNYDGTDKYIAVNKPDNATVYYSKNELNENNYKEKGSTNNIGVKDLGTTTIYWCADAIDYIPYCSSNTVTIGEGIINATGSDYTGTYDGLEHRINVSVTSPSSSTIYYLEGTELTKDNYKSKGSTDNPPKTTLGTTIVYWCVEATGYTTLCGNNKITINNAQMEASGTDYNGNYDGNGHSITVNVTKPASGADIYYSTTTQLNASNYTSGSTTNPTINSLGETPVYWCAVANNYNPICSSNKINLTKLANNYITSLWGTTQGNGEVLKENGIRYEGKNPNNYVSFNDELWRIIGVFDGETHGRSGEQLVKLIRAEALPQYYQWDSSNKNNWNNSTLKTTLNTNYYNNKTINACSNYKEYRCTAVAVTGKGIKSDAIRNMIQEVQWKIGGYDYNEISARIMYREERGTTTAGSSGATAVTTETLPIGLMYPSDYGYAVQEGDCRRTMYFKDYNFETCHTENWLWNSANHQWTLSPNSANSVSVWSVYGYNTDNVNTIGQADSNYETDITFVVSPVLYLKQNVKITGGTGTSSDPYTLSM